MSLDFRGVKSCGAGNRGSAIPKRLLSEGWKSYGLCTAAGWGQALCTGHPWVLLLGMNCQDKGASDEEALQSPSSIFFSFSTLRLKSPALVY